MNIIRVHDDGRREKVAGYDGVTLETGRKLMRTWPPIFIITRDRIETRGDLRVYTIEVSLDDVVILTLEEEWPTKPEDDENG